MLQALRERREVDIEELERIPKHSPWLVSIGWGLTALVLGSLLYVGVAEGATAARDHALYWVLELTDVPPCDATWLPMNVPTPMGMLT